MVKIKGTVFDVGMLENGRGFKIESDGEEVEIIGLTEEECKKVAQFLGEDIEITIASEGIKGWTPIDTAPNDTPVIVGWLDADDHDDPERYDFDLKEDGVWVKHEELYQDFCCAAPPGSHGPKETAPYTHWMALKPIAEAMIEAAPTSPAPEPISTGSVEPVAWAAVNLGGELYNPQVTRPEYPAYRGNYHLDGIPTVDLYSAEQLATLQAKLEQAEMDSAGLQAKIDTLMLEFCPGEVTQEQLGIWAKHQVVTKYGVKS